jgi:predicted Rossmann-fold nucleotide-binding protein
LTLIQTGKVRNFPVVLFGRAYWHGLLEWLESTMATHGNIHLEDMNLLVVTDSPEEAVRVVIDCYDENCARAEQASEAARRSGRGGFKRAALLRRRPRKK